MKRVFVHHMNGEGLDQPVHLFILIKGLSDPQYIFIQ